MIPLELFKHTLQCHTAPHLMHQVAKRTHEVKATGCSCFDLVSQVHTSSRKGTKFPLDNWGKAFRMRRVACRVSITGSSRARRWTTIRSVQSRVSARWHAAHKSASLASSVLMKKQDIEDPSRRSSKKGLGIGATSVGALLLIAASQTGGQVFNWGGSSDDNWNNYLNWSPGSAPADFPNQPGESAIFGDPTNSLSPTLNQTPPPSTTTGNVTIDSITFNANAGAFTIQTNGQTLTLVGAGIVNNSANVQRINNNNLGVSDQGEQFSETALRQARRQLPTAASAVPRRSLTYRMPGMRR